MGGAHVPCATHPRGGDHGDRGDRGGHGEGGGGEGVRMEGGEEEGSRGGEGEEGSRGGKGEEDVGSESGEEEAGEDEEGVVLQCQDGGHGDHDDGGDRVVHTMVSHHEGS